MKTIHNKVLIFYHFQVPPPIDSSTTVNSTTSPPFPTAANPYLRHDSDHHQRCVASLAARPQPRIVPLQIQVRDDGR